MLSKPLILLLASSVLSSLSLTPTSASAISPPHEHLDIGRALPASPVSSPITRERGVPLSRMIKPVKDAVVGLGKRAEGEGYDDPYTGGGSMLTWANNTYPPNLGEPLNAILLTTSDPRVLVDSPDNGGFLNYMLANNLGEECLGQHLGNPQKANLGDGLGERDEVQVLRWNYGDVYLGTCRETFDGGLHLRYWVQNTTGAIFLAVSEEMNLANNHDIIPNGYNLGRDWLVGNATAQSSPVPTVKTLDVNGTEREVTGISNKTTFVGEKSWGNWTYRTEVSYVYGLLPNSSDGVNHADSVAPEGMYAVDGLVALLKVTITGEPPSSGAARIGASVGLMGAAVLVALMGMM